MASESGNSWQTLPRRIRSYASTHSTSPAANQSATQRSRKASLLKYLAPLHSTGKWLLLSVVVGLVAGLGAIVFDIASQSIRYVALEKIAGYVPLETAGENRIIPAPPRTGVSALRLIGVMAGGGLLSGLIVLHFAPEAEGHGTDAAIAAFHHKRGYIRPIVPPVKLISSALTIGTGGSGGREGPITQIGAGFGSLLATIAKLPAHDRRILSAVGMSAGIGAIFRHHALNQRALLALRARRRVAANLPVTGDRLHRPLRQRRPRGRQRGEKGQRGDGGGANLKTVKNAHKL